MTTTLKIGMLTDSQITYGVDLTPEELRNLSKWQKEADGWTIELRSVDVTKQEADEWHSFNYWKGPGHHGEPPTVSDLIQSVAADSNYLWSEPEELTYPMGKQIEANEAKMRALFGSSQWERIKAYDDDEIAACFGPFS